MTGYITLFDTITESAWPADPQAVLGYVDGHVGDQPDWAYVQQRFPNARHLSIALSPAHDAMALDIETGAASPASAAAWYERQKARGVARPCFYASASLMEATIIPVVRAAAIPREGVRLWSAHYTHTAHICGPASCRLTSVAMDGTQWTDRAFGRNLDQSLLLPDFFGTAPSPQPHPTTPTLEEIVAQVPVVQKGSTGQPAKNVQGLLNARGAALALDGDFGDKSEAALVAVQKRLGLADDGVCGAITMKALLTRG